jgi:apolipoprotein D and lipocalin family protein
MNRSMMAALALLAAASGAFADSRRPPFQKVVERVDLDRFLGSWYVIALLPSPFERNAANGVETYSLDPRGNIRVEYVFREGGPGGKRKVMHQKGWIVDKESNSEWKVQPLWPLKLPYLIIDLAEDYRYAVIGTDNYKYVWIMGKAPSLSAEDYAGILSRLADRGYKVADIRLMPQAW